MTNQEISRQDQILAGVKITKAQRATLRRLRAMPANNGGSYEIAATRFSGNVLHMFCAVNRVEILPDGSYSSSAYGRTSAQYGLTDFVVDRPVDNLIDA